MAQVEVEDLWVRYGKFTAVRGISFEIPRGEVFGFIGPNGAGKTSTIKVLATLLQPSAGTARVGGVDVRSASQRVKYKIGYMPDSFGVYDDLTAVEYLQFFAAAYRLDPAQRDATVRDVLELTDLSGKRDAPVNGLSRGMKQRLGLARVLLHDPEVLLLDEPASGLDPRARIEMRELLKELRSMGKTILISSHILHELAELCTRIGIVEAGKLVAEGSLTEIYAQLGILRTVHVQVVNPTEDLLDRLQGLSGVRRAEQQIDRFSLQIAENEVEPASLLEEVQSLGARVHMFQPEAMDMETVFMKLTEGQTQ